MRRVARFAFTLCSAVSLLLCAAACVLWARSGTVMDGVRHAVPVRSDAVSTSSFTLFTRGNALHYLYVGPSEGTPPGWKVLNDPQPPRFVTMTDRPKWQALGFGRGGGTGWRFVSVPFWFLVPSMLVLPALWLLAQVRRRRLARAGRCLTCGYDLRASPGRCPECGTAAPSLSRAADPLAREVRAGV